MAEHGRGLLAVWTDIPAAVEEDFNRWYNEEHIPERVGIPGFLNGRRYLSLTGTPKYMALYSTVDAQVLQSETYRKVLVNATAWTQKVRPHFQNFVRNEYELLLDLGSSVLVGVAQEPHLARAPHRSAVARAADFRNQHVPVRQDKEPAGNREALGKERHQHRANLGGRREQERIAECRARQPLPEREESEERPRAAACWSQ